MTIILSTKFTWFYDDYVVSSYQVTSVATHIWGELKIYIKITWSHNDGISTF